PDGAEVERAAPVEPHDSEQGVGVDRAQIGFEWREQLGVESLVVHDALRRPNAGLRCARRFTRAFPISYRASPAAHGSGAAATPAAGARRGGSLPPVSPAFGLAVRQLPEPGFAEPPDTAGSVPAASAL